MLAAVLVLVGLVSGIGSFRLAAEPYLGGGVLALSGLLSIVVGLVGGFLVRSFGRFALELFGDHAEAAKGSTVRR